MVFPPIPPSDPGNSVVVQRMLEFQKDLVARDADTILFMGQRWMQLESVVEANISLLIMEIAEAGIEPDIQSIYKLNRYQKLLAQVQQEMTTYNVWAAEYIALNQETMAVLGINNAAEAMTLSLLEGGAMSFFDKIPVDAVELMIGNAGKGGPVFDLLQTKYPEAVGQMTNALIEGVALGHSTSQTAQAMMMGLEFALDHGLTVARTEQLRVYREASRQQYASSGAVKGYKRMASKSGNTCALCLALDGEIYPTSDLMSVHPNDRCVMIPLVRGASEPTWESGEDWLRRQDPEMQKQILGPGALEMWENGDIELMDLVNKVDHPTWGPSLKRTPLKDLSK